MRIATLSLLALLASAGLADAQTTQSYGYDAHGRVVSATVGIGPRSGGSFTTYSTDAADNRSAKYAEPIPALAAADRLQINERLTPGQSILSADNRFYFLVQLDGNVVIYGPTGALWSTNTFGSQAMVLAMQSDGNLQLWNSTGWIWETFTSGHPGAYLIMQNDGDLVLYDGSTMIWHSNTCCH